MDKKTKLELNLNENNFKKAQFFFSKYEMVSILGDSTKKFMLGDRDNRICRFCRKSKNEVKFKKDSHVIPEFMGNHNLLSFFECDICNSLFSKYEDSFCNFMGILRTISQIKGKKNKVPKYKDPKTGLEMMKSNTGLEMTFIEGFEVLDIDKENKSFTVKTKKPGYIPIHIPKILIKIGFCMLLDEELNDFELTRKFLIDLDNGDKFKDSSFLKIFGYFIPGVPKFNKPFVQLFKKKFSCEEELIPQYQIILYYASYQFQMTLPYGKKDERLQGKKIHLPIMPLLIDNSHLERFGSETLLDLNLTSSEKKSNEEHNITFSYTSFDDIDLSNETNK